MRTRQLLNSWTDWLMFSCRLARLYLCVKVFQFITQITRPFKEFKFQLNIVSALCRLGVWKIGDICLYVWNWMKCHQQFSFNHSKSCTHCLFFCSSPYSQPSFSSGISSVMMSLSSKLSSVLLFPDLWGNMVRTLGLLSMWLRPVAIDTDLDSPLSSLYSREDKTDIHPLINILWTLLLAQWAVMMSICSQRLTLYIRCIRFIK